MHFGFRSKRGSSCQGVPDAGVSTFGRGFLVSGVTARDDWATGMEVLLTQPITREYGPASTLQAGAQRPCATLLDSSTPRLFFSLVTLSSPYLQDLLCYYVRPQ